VTGGAVVVVAAVVGGGGGSVVGGGGRVDGGGGNVDGGGGPDGGGGTWAVVTPAVLDTRGGYRSLPRRSMTRSSASERRHGGDYAHVIPMRHFPNGSSVGALGFGYRSR
jgi:hypothetical protein